MLDKKSVVIALGFFDSVHIGHRKVIETAKETAKNLGTETAVFTFGGNLKSVILNREEKFVYSVKERKNLLNDLGITEIFFAPITKEFLSQDKISFLNYLNTIYDIKGYVCGEDYTFGEKGLGNVNTLINYAKERNQQVKIVSSVLDDLGRISTTRIKRLLTDGNIQKANLLLGSNFFVLGEVYGDRKVGKTLGFPTVNIKTEDGKITLLDGVYSGYTIIENKIYKCVINCGARPTFSLYEKVIEAHILDFSNDLYGKEIPIYFLSRIRDVQKFSSKEALIKRITEDVNSVLGNV
ncbi:MAG: riboflavin biosynthesis protein RibF [Clostridia bacterium]|nr:riboflavin biosynthesis protein RibF [Clostridia bacterium]